MADIYAIPFFMLFISILHGGAKLGSLGLRGHLGGFGKVWFRVSSYLQFVSN